MIYKFFILIFYYLTFFGINFRIGSRQNKSITNIIIGKTKVGDQGIVVTIITTGTNNTNAVILGTKDEYIIILSVCKGSKSGGK